MIAQYFSEHAEDHDIYHRHFATNSIAYYLSRISKTPYTITTHAWDLFANERYKHLNSVLKNAKKVITISEFNKSFIMENMDLQPEKIEVVRMGIDPSRFTSGKTKGDIGKFLSVGRLVEKKGLEYAISAFGKAVKKYPGIEYTIVGSGPEEPKLRDKVKELKLEDKVQIKSHISNEDLVEEYNKAGTFILPCIRAQDGDMDGIPVVLMEAMAMEKLVISTSVSGIPELIEHGRSGLLVKPRDAKELSETMDKVLSQGVDSNTLSKEARATVIKDFNINGQVSSMELIFKDVLSGDT
jgi:glycosyltransferase involved in cell wall biosynthesis